MTELIAPYSVPLLKISWTYKRKIKTQPEAKDGGCQGPPTKALPLITSNSS
jgi:hypothetical protein